MDPFFSLVVGALVSYTFPGGTDVWCMKINAITRGAGDVAVAWAADTRDPRRVLQIPLAELRPGCATEPGA
jgi:hypothetical protein